MDTCGSKAATCSQLAKLALAADAAAAFRTPRGCAVTYAALQDTLHANGKKKVTVRCLFPTLFPFVRMQYTSLENTD